MARAIVILNAQAGLLLETGAEAAVRTVERAFADAGRPARVVLAAAPEIDDHLARAAASDCDTIVVGGGDGTVNGALARLSGTGKTLGVIPLGSLNLLGQDLAVPLTLEAAATAVARAERRMVDLATVNGRPFHTLCGLGFFARVARARQAVRLAMPFGRAIGVGVASVRTMMRSGRLHLTIEIEGDRRPAEAYAVLVTNNRMGPDLRRARLDEGTLELHLMHHTGLFGRARTAVSVMSGRWRDSRSIETLAAASIDIASRRSRVWVSVDGELRREEAPLAFRIKPRAQPMLIPADTASA
jgi:diacylglycerol kinase family enzyme